MVRMVTKFTKGMDYFNSLLDQTEVGSECYKLLHKAKMKYIIDFK